MSLNTLHQVGDAGAPGWELPVEKGKITHEQLKCSQSMAMMGWFPLCPIAGVRRPHQGCRGARPGGGIQRGCGAETPSPLSLGATVGNILCTSSMSLNFISVTGSCDQLQPQHLVTHVTAHAALQVFCLTEEKRVIILINKAFIL